MAHSIATPNPSATRCSLKTPSLIPTTWCRFAMRWSGATKWTAR